MKNNNRNGVFFLVILLLVVIGYTLIYLYSKELKLDIDDSSKYQNNLTKDNKQPVNDIIAVTIPTPSIKPTETKTPIPTPKATSKPANNDNKEIVINKNIIFEYSYDSGNYISLLDQFPITDEVGKSLNGDKKNQNFKLKFNNKAVGLKYTITMEKLDGSNLDDEWVKVFLVNDGADVMNCYRNNNRIKTFNEYEKYKNNSKEKIIYEGVINTTEASRGYKDFTLRMWISEDLQLNNSDYLSEGRTYKTRINVYASENK